MVPAFCGSSARAQRLAGTKVSVGSPMFSALQVAPRSMLFHTPVTRVPAYIAFVFCGSIASARIASPEFRDFTALQLTPSFVVLNIALSTPAYNVLGFCGSIARAIVQEVLTGSPEFTALQLAPPFVLMNTPPILSGQQ